MTYVKKLVMHGFKSFAPKTEIVFDKGINTIVGPNGSGKSNISDALCFVLGRLSIKSIRAAKAKNLLFMGTKMAKPAREASVEIVFDNSNKTFQLPSPEVSIKRTVKNNGQSVYKINNETKTRSEIVETLAHSGIDPHGFNIVMQGQIQAIVKMHPDERRKIIEEVAGISIYEARKEKSLKELDKTESRLKEISTILRERKSFLNNLERERSQALRYTELERTIKKCKASILDKRLKEKEKELASAQKSISEKEDQKSKVKQSLQALESEIESTNQEINKINKHIQRSTGIEQETLRTQIANLKAEIEGLRVRKENYENRRDEIERRVNELEKTIPEHEREIADLKKESPMVAKKQEELTKKKAELKELENEKSQIYSLKSDLNAVKDKIRERETQISKLNSDSDSLLKQIESISSEFKHESKDSCEKELSTLKSNLQASKEKLESLRETQLDLTKKLSIHENTISESEKTKSQVKEIDTCPLCQTKMTSEHLNHVVSTSDEKINSAKSELESIQTKLSKISSEKTTLSDSISSLETNISSLESELSSHRMVSDKKSTLKNLLSQEKTLETEIKQLTEKRLKLQNQTSDVSRIDEKYTSKLMEIEEISARTAEDLDKTLMYKERELEKTREVIKSSKRDLNELDEDVAEIHSSLESKSSILEQKESEDATLSEKFKQLFTERDSLQEKIQNLNHELSSRQHSIRGIEDQVNMLKVAKARIDAEKEAVEMELHEFKGVEIISGNLDSLKSRLEKAQTSLNSIGPINMRALEVYEEVKQEYDKVQVKVDTLEKEKEEILKIIEEIDRKKKRTFMKTYKGINGIFSENFGRLSSKGQAFLEIENKEDIFSGGINIVVKLAKGKYFDVSSLSGGEQTLIALSLLFAIQEYRPYHFYILDEIDAALDKRNSERLSGLLRKYMQQGQYIVVTHNDALIMDSNILYGVSMHEGVSKILSLKLD